MNLEHDYILTFTGKRFYPMAPCPEDICIEDIAHALSLTCRFGGHCKFHYSVAQHSILMHDNVEPEFRKHCLLHDASEAYASDIVRPLKHQMPEYLEVERRIEMAVAEKFNLEFPWPSIIKDHDNRALLTEKRDVMNQRGDEVWAFYTRDGYPLQPYKEEIQRSTPELTEYLFLSKFKTLA